MHVCILASVQSAKAVWAFFHQPSANLSQKKDQDYENDVTTDPTPEVIDADDSLRAIASQLSSEENEQAGFSMQQ